VGPLAILRVDLLHSLIIHSTALAMP